MLSRFSIRALTLSSRGVSTSSACRQQPLENSPGHHEDPLRPAACQMGTMLDIGARNIFNSDHDMFREQVRRWMRERLAPLQNSFEENGQPTREIWTEMGEQVSVWIRSVIGFMFSNLIRVCLESLSRQRLEE